MSFHPRTLELFIRVAALGALGKAGREFGLSPTAATQRIQALEAELGVKLFNRTTRAVALTAEGEVFLVHARRIITSVEDARSELSGGTTNIKGELRVAGSASFGRRYIAPIISEFLHTHPDVRVRLELSDSVVDVVEQGFDLAFRIGSVTGSSFVTQKIADNPRLLVASPTYLENSEPLRQPEDLISHNCIVLADNRNWKLRDRKGEIHEVRVAGNFTTNYGEAITEAAVADAGIALKSIWDIRELLAAGSLIPVLEDYCVEPLWSLWAIRPPGQMVPARVRAFVDFMEMKFRQFDS